MKKVLIVLSVFAFGFGYAQINTKGTKQLMFSVFTGDAQLVYKKYIKDGFALRYSIRGNYKYNKNLNPLDYEELNGVKNVKYSYSFNGSVGFGFQKSIIKIDEKVDIYGGIEAFLGNSLSKSYNETMVLDSVLAYKAGFRGSKGDYSKVTYNRPVSVNLTFVPFVGFKYFFHPRLAFGAECRMSVLSFFFNSPQIIEKETKEYKKTTTTKNVNEGTTGEFNFNLNTAANITITLLLNKPTVEKKIEN